MTICEFCKSKYVDDRLEFCPGCGAKLKKVPDPPRQVVFVQPPPTSKSASNKRMIAGAVAGFLAIAILWGVLSSMGQKRSDGKPAMADSGASAADAAEPEGQALFKNEFMPQIAERIWPGEKITVDTLQKLTYLSLYTQDDILNIGYGFGDPFSEDFEAEYLSIPLTGNTDETVELKPFKGVEKLETNSRLAYSAIEDMHGLKYLKCQYYAEDLTELEGSTALESLVINAYSLSSLEGVENLPALQELSLERAKITDLSPLSRCGNLTSLSLDHCDDIQNLSIIGDFGGLTSFSIMGSDSTELNFIGKLKMLKSLTVSGTKTKTLAFVGELPNLEYLCLTGNSDAKIMPSFDRFAGSLNELILGASGFDDVNFLAALTNLKRLELYNPPSVNPLSGMTGLEDLTISPGWGVDTLAPLGGLTSLKKLTFAKNMGFTPWNNNVFSFLSNLTELEELSFEDCGLYFNADPVYTLKNLKSLNYSGNTVCGNFKDIANLTNLESLRLAKTRLASSFWVESDGFVTSIGIDGEQTMDSQASSLSALSGLRELDVSNTDLQDITFLKNLKNLEYFYASGNYITDVFVLSELPELKTADLSANAVTNWEALDSLSGTQVIGRP